MRILLLLAVGISLAACGQKSNQQTQLKADSGIIGGTVVSEGDEIALQTVGIYDSGSETTCTGVLLSSNAVLTAAHCAYKVNPDRLKIVFAQNIAAILATSEQDVRDELLRPVIQIKVHQKYNPDIQEENGFDWADIAVLRFKGAVPQGYKPALILEDIKSIKPGLKLTLAGYGVDDVKLYPINPRKVKNLSEAIAYGEVICDEERKNCEEVAMSGDGELKMAETEIGFVIRSEIRTDESDGHGTCSGDSGGPAFLTVQGQKYVVGITSRGQGTCDGVSIYTNVTYYLDWIRDIVSGFKN